MKELEQAILRLKRKGVSKKEILEKVDQCFSYSILYDKSDFRHLLSLAKDNIGIIPPVTRRICDFEEAIHENFISLLVLNGIDIRTNSVITHFRMGPSTIIVEEKKPGWKKQVIWVEDEGEILNVAIKI